MLPDADIEAIAKIGRELATKEDIAAVSARLERVFSFYDGILAGTVVGLTLAVVILVIALVSR